MAPQLDRRNLMENPEVHGIEFCRSLAATVDEWIRRLWLEADPPESGAALVAVGGYGRAELSPGSDIDLWLLHDPKVPVADLAERIWYPIWDQNVKLGHAVRTIKETLSLAADDLDTATAVLSVRPIAGDPRFAATLAEKGSELWRKRSRRWIADLDQRTVARHQRAGEVAFLLEPDLKDGRGGLRDVHGIRWAELAGIPLLPGDEEALSQASQVILSARVELHRRTGRQSDVLLLDEQDAVAAALGHRDADDLMRSLSTAARTIAWVSDELWARARSSIEGRFRSRVARDREVSTGVVVRDGTVAVTAAADLTSDPELVLRVAVAAATLDLRIDRDSLDRLTAAPAPPTPWPASTRSLFVDLMRAGPPMVRVIETLDQKGLWEPLMPEWSVIRCRPQRNAYHRFTVDRHLCETVANASTLTENVSRPDLLVIGALLHDIGKGRPGDHTEVGIELVAEIGPRMGFDARDTAMLQQMVRHHLLLPDVATRRDLSDDGTISFVADAVGTSACLELLDALTEADSIATGPSAWGSWKKGLVRTLVSKVGHVLDGGRVEEVTGDGFPSDAQLELLARGERILEGDGDRLVVVCPDRPGLFSRVAGVLSLNGLTVLEAAVHTSAEAMALEQYRVRSDFDEAIDWDRVLADLTLALDGRLAIEARLADRRRRYAAVRRLPGVVTHPEVIVDNELSHEFTVIEVRTRDGVGVLWRITRALHDLDLDIRSAKIQTLGSDAVDSFYVADPTGAKIVDVEYLGEIRRALMQAIERSAEP